MTESKRPIACAAALLKYINEAKAAELKMKEAKNKYFHLHQLAVTKARKFLRASGCGDLDGVKRIVLRDYPSLKEKYE